MALTEFVRGEFIEVIEWTDDSRSTLSHRFEDADKAIKNGAQLIVRESQSAQLVYLGQFGDTFGPGRHRLVTDNIPVLTRLRSWKYALESPFKVDVYFLNTRLFTGNKWGTTNPVMVRDGDLGVVRVRAFGTYDFHITSPARFLREVAGSDHDFTAEEFTDTMRSRVVSAFSDALAAARVSVFDVAGRYRELGDALLPALNPLLSAKYGLEATSFVIENVSVPAEVETAIDKRSAMAAIGNLNDYVKFQMAQGMGNGAGPASAATELAMGLAVAQELVRQQGGLATAAPAVPEVLSPADVAVRLAVPESDVIAAIESGELPAKQIGSAYRVTRASLDRYLNR